MSNPKFTMRQLLESGAHFGHHVRRWNPKMKEFIYGTNGGVHIIDLRKTVPMLDQALKVVQEIAASGGRVLFVGTKTQASERVAEAAKKCGQYYVDHRWLGGMLTNWKTVSQSIKRLKEMDEKVEAGQGGLTKKEFQNLTLHRDKLNRTLGGIREMGGVPDVLFVIDTNKEATAITEAKTLGIPVIAIVDTNSNPDPIDYPIPGNDDASRAIGLYCDLVADAVLSGIQDQMRKAGVDLGASAELPKVHVE